MKPIVTKQEYFKFGFVPTRCQTFTCPACKSIISAGAHYQPKHCAECGVKLDFDGIIYEDEETMSYKVYRYYCRFRPPMPGGIPRKGLVNAASFDYPQSYDGIGCWGWAEYTRELTEQEISDYELAASKNNPLEYA